MLGPREGRDGPSERPGHGLGSAGIPLLETLLVHVDVGLAEEEAADFVAHAPEGSHLSPHLPSEGRDPVGGMAPADGDHRTRTPFAIPSNEVAAAALEARPLAASPEDFSRRRKSHDPEAADAVDRESQVHRPVLSALAVLLGPVEGIHDPDPRLREPPPVARRLLAQDAIVGIAAGEDSLEEPVRGLIADVTEEGSLPSIRMAKRLEALPRGPCGVDSEANLGTYWLSPASLSKDWSSLFSIASRSWLLSATPFESRASRERAPWVGGPSPMEENEESRASLLSMPVG